MADPAEPALASRKILVVDDQPSIRGVLEATLTEAGAEVFCAAGGAEALSLLERTSPELILLDLVMPGMDGWRVLEALKASPRTATIPVVLETSAQDFDSFEQARKHGVAAFISKPFRLDEVVETCRRILIGARPLQGTQPKAERLPLVEARDPDGSLLAAGGLLDLADNGAQVELDRALPLAGTASFTIHGPGGILTRKAEVRWVTRTGDRFQHGLMFQE